jgi:hypothetical protein
MKEISELSKILHIDLPNDLCNEFDAESLDKIHNEMHQDLYWELRIELINNLENL